MASTLIQQITSIWNCCFFGLWSDLALGKGRGGIVQSLNIWFNVSQDLNSMGVVYYRTNDLTVLI